LFENIAAGLREGLSVETAVELGVARSVAAANDQLAEGADLDQVLTNEGLERVALKQAFAMDSSGGMVMQLVIPTHDLPGIPSPECVERHLPKDRPATSEEIRAAWRRCQS
jgi:hypothetical protein